MVTRVYKRLEGVRGGYKVLQWVTRGTRGYRGLQGVTSGCIGYTLLQGVTRGYRG